MNVISSFNRCDKHPARPSKRPIGFTLVELLVVIGIIALLISVLMPALSRARAAANTVKCLSNLRQIGVAFQLYENEHQSRLIPAAVPAVGGVDNWDKIAVQMLTKNNLTQARDIVFVCPANQERANDTTKYCYSVSSALCGDMQTNPTNPSWPLRITQIKRPSERILAFDSFGGNCVGANPDGSGNLACFNWHPKSAANYLFCDGSASTLIEKAFDDPKAIRATGTNAKGEDLYTSNMTRAMWFRWTDRKAAGYGTANHP